MKMTFIMALLIFPPLSQREWQILAQFSKGWTTALLVNLQDLATP